LLIKVIKLIGAHLVFDIDDAVWSTNLWGLDVSDRIFENVDSIVCDNKYLLDFIADRYGLNGEVRIGSLPNRRTIVGQKLEKNFKQRVMTIGWVGSPSTTYNLLKIAEYLILLDRDPRFQLIFLGADKKLMAFMELKHAIIIEVYDEELMSQYLLDRFDVGLFPMYNVVNNFGRGYHKLRIYLMYNLKCLISRIDFVEDDFFKDDRCLFLSSDDDWYLECIKIYEDRGLYGSNTRI
jgi:hypothetical protein